MTALSSNKSGQNSDPNSDDEADTGGKRRRHGRGPAKETDIHSAAPKAHPVGSEPRRIQVDIEQAQALVRKLDSEKGVEENILCGSENDKVGRDKSHSGSTGPVIIIRGLTSVKGLEGVELLDTLITYLWRVHGLDYYGMIETNEAKGARHVRAEGKSSETTSGAEWEKKLDSRWQERLRGQDPLEVMTCKEKIDAAAVEALDPYVRKIRDEKYGWKFGCGAKGCTKLFHAAEFVHKHLKLKHPELVMELTVKVREELYFQNYMKYGFPLVLFFFFLLLFVITDFLTNASIQFTATQMLQGERLLCSNLCWYGYLISMFILLTWLCTFHLLYCHLNTISLINREQNKREK